MDQIKKVLKEHYYIDISHVRSQQGGWASLAYRVSNDKEGYFLKVYEKSRASTPKLTSRIDDYAPMLDWLNCHSGLQGKISVPLVTKNGKFQCEDDEGIYLLYDYVDGETIGNQELTEKQVQQLAEIVTDLHLYGEEIPIETNPIKEDYHIPFLSLFRDLCNIQISVDAVRDVINPYMTAINGLVDTVKTLARSLENRKLRLALCHTDLHYWNLMQSSKQLILIDWEGLKLAPVEADFMFFVDKPYFRRLLTIYQQTHHNFRLDLDVLHFYQGRRKLEDIGEFVEQLLYDSLQEQERLHVIKDLQKVLQSIKPKAYG